MSELNKESVEQAGGDERAAFELFVRKHCGMPEHIAVNWDAKFTHDAWEGWQARAALAQPSPAPELERPATFSVPSCENSYGFGYVDGTCIQSLRGYRDHLETIVNALPEGELMTVAQHECIVEARWNRAMDLLLDHVSRISEKFKAERAAALARVAELERQEPVVRAYGVLPPFAEKVLAKLRRFYDCAEDFESGGVDIGRHWLDLLTQLGLLNRVQRSPALWEISQQGEDLLEAPVAQAQHSVPDHAELLQALERTHAGHMVGHDQSDQPKGGYSDGYVNGFGECIKVARKVLAAAPGNSAQHSVPEGYALIPVRETEAMHDAVMALLYKGVARTDTQKLLDAYIAAAPGKEVGHE